MTIKMVALAAAMVAVSGAALAQSAPVSAASSSTSHTTTLAQVCHIFGHVAYKVMRNDQRDFVAGRPWGSTNQAMLAKFRAAVSGPRPQSISPNLFLGFQRGVKLIERANSLAQKYESSWVPEVGISARRAQAREFANDIQAACNGGDGSDATPNDAAASDQRDPGLPTGQSLIFGRLPTSGVFPMAPYKIPMPSSCADPEMQQIADAEYLSYYGAAPVPEMIPRGGVANESMALCVWEVAPSGPGAPPMLLQVTLQGAPGGYIGIIDAPSQ